jgi:hypothetical protein
MMHDKSVAVSGSSQSESIVCMIDTLETRFHKAVDALSEWLANSTTPEWRKRHSELCAEVNEAVRQLQAARGLGTQAHQETSLDKGHGARAKH